MAGFGQYLKDTRSELKHVAWPTQMQTIVYTIMVVAVSVFVAFYLGFFDFLFTGALSRLVNAVPATAGQQNAQTVPSSTQTPAAATPPSSTTTPITPGQFKL